MAVRDELVETTIATTQLEAQLEKELSFHLEQHTSQLMARGIPPDEARRQARLALGGPEQVKEKCRDARARAGWKICCRTPAMRFAHSGEKPGFTVVALLILSLGSGATTVMFA